MALSVYSQLLQNLYLLKTEKNYESFREYVWLMNLIEYELSCINTE